MAALFSPIRWLAMSILSISASVSVSSASPPASPRLADFWEGRAVFQVDEVSRFGAEFGMHFLATWSEPRQIWTYFIATADPSIQPHRLAVGLARTNDGVTFEKLGIVLPPGKDGDWDDRMASFAGVWKSNAASWAMVYEGAGKSARSPGDIGLATSIDGQTWAKYREPILVHATSRPGDQRELNLAWERQNVGTPSLWKEGEIYFLFYHGFGKGKSLQDVCQVGVATGRDLRSLVRNPSNPILPAGKPGAWDGGTIGKRSIRKEGGFYYMAYEGSEEQPYDKARWSTGIARSEDLLKWEKFPDPVLPRTNSGFGYDGPEWIETPDGELHIYFRNPAGRTSRATLVFRP